MIVGIIYSVKLPLNVFLYWKTNLTYLKYTMSAWWFNNLLVYFEGYEIDLLNKKSILNLMILYHITILLSKIVLSTKKIDNDQ